jgi:RNA 3'-terminal phosphate cyclase (ATP)
MAKIPGELSGAIRSPEGMSTSLIELDGSEGEGGGQILRTSLALSLLTGRGFHLRHVRAGRSKPGLQPQHLMSVRAAATIGQAHTAGASRGSTDLVFEPGAIVAGDQRFAIGTAGATGLVLHTVYLPLALRAQKPCRLTLEGGTHVSTSPSYDFNAITWRHYLAAMGLNVELELIRTGFYPRGGGEVRAIIHPCSEIRGLTLRDRMARRGITGVSAVAGLPEEIAERQARRALKRLRDAGLQADIRLETWTGGPGTVLSLTFDTVPAPTLVFALGARGKRAEEVADEAVEQAVAFHRAAPAAVDVHSADQLLLPLALAPGRSEYTVAEVTRHLTTNIAVIRRFCDREISVDGAEGTRGTVRIE